MTASRWEAAGRLGVQTIKCEHCAATMPMVLPQRQDHPAPKGREPIRTGYWRVEARDRRWTIPCLPSKSWVCCSQDCARALSDGQGRAHRYAIPRQRFSVHGPVGVCVES